MMRRENRINENLIIEDTDDVLNVINLVSDSYSIDSGKLVSQDRHIEFSIPRHLAIYFIKSYSGYTQTKIGGFFSGRDHSTVSHSCQTAEDKFYTRDTLFIRKYNELKRAYSNYKANKEQENITFYDFSKGWDLSYGKY